MRHRRPRRRSRFTGRKSRRPTAGRRYNTGRRYSRRRTSRRRGTSRRRQVIGDRM